MKRLFKRSTLRCQLSKVPKAGGPGLILKNTVLASCSAADRQEIQGALIHGDTPLHRRAQPTRSSHPADGGAREDEDPYDCKKDK